MRKATYQKRQPGEPFFAVFNLNTTHESRIHRSVTKLNHNPEQVPLPPYHLATPEMKHDWAHYYDQIERMDQKVGKLLRELEEAGLADNTIVFYYSDHGGAIGAASGLSMMPACAYHLLSVFLRNMHTWRQVNLVPEQIKLFPL